MAEAAPTDLRKELTVLMPSLRRLAISFTRRPHDADDLVQQALLKALLNLDKFQRGTNFRAWLVTILRNCFYNDIRYQKFHETVPLDETAHLSQPQPQETLLEFKDMLMGLSTLPPQQREILILVAGEGRTYEEAAALCHCEVGTVKSRTSRARDRLQAYMARKPRKAKLFDNAPGRGSSKAGSHNGCRASEE